MKQSPSLDVHITGWAHSRFGKLPATLEELVVEVTREALASAQIEPSDIFSTPTTSTLRATPARRARTP